MRATRATSVAALRWMYTVQTLAAVRGWELPPVPLECTAEYLAGKADGDSNPELGMLSQLASGLVPAPEHNSGA